MLDSIKDVLTKDIELDSIKEALTKDIDTKPLQDFLEMEIEISRLKELLETEIKLKEFLLQDIDIKSFVSTKQQQATAVHATDTEVESEFIDDQQEQLELDSTEMEIVRETPKANLPVYDLGLLEALKTDQKELIFLYEQILKLAESKKHALAAGLLEDFTSRIATHFHLAEKELYTYLKSYIEQIYPNRNRAFTELSLEMKNISISIFYTLTQSPNFPLNKTNHEAFIKEFVVLKEQLQSRFDREEKVLFPMYEKSHEVS